jgi:hypothetical protein
MSAIRKLAAPATDNGLPAPELAAGIARVKSAKSIGDSLRGAAGRPARYAGVERTAAKKCRGARV